MEHILLLILFFKYNIWIRECFKEHTILLLSASGK